MFIITMLALISISHQEIGSFADLTRIIYTMSGGCLGLIFLVFTLAGAWKIFEKTGQSGWAALIPFYNIWILLRIVGRPGWWLLFYFIPLVGQIAWIVNMWDLARSFDRRIGYTMGLVVLPFIFVPLLGFDDMQHYYGPVAAHN